MDGFWALPWEKISAIVATIAVLGGGLVAGIRLVVRAGRPRQDDRAKAAIQEYLSRGPARRSFRSIRDRVKLADHDVLRILTELGAVETREMTTTYWGLPSRAKAKTPVLPKKAA